MENTINSKNEKMKFHEFGLLMNIAFEKDEYDKAVELAFEYLELAKSNMKNWNYGNAIHEANLVLGKISLRRGDIKSAKDYLIEAGKTKGSPQLNSFGPNMSLAKELLELGEDTVVIGYLNLVKKFWFILFSFRKLRRWKKKILNGCWKKSKKCTIFFS